MYRISSMSPCEVQGTIRFYKQPWSLGYRADVDGNMWDIHGYIGLGDRPYVQACRVDNLHPGLTDTSGLSCGYSQTWKPYWVEIVEKQNNSGVTVPAVSVGIHQD